MKLTINKHDFAVVALIAAVIKPHLLPEILQIVIKLLLLIYVMVYIVQHLPVRKILNLSVLFGLAVIVSSAVGYGEGNISTQNLFNGILHAICLYCLYTLPICFRESGETQRYLHVSFVMMKIYCAISFVSILFIRPLGDPMPTYFFGATFFTCYMFILLSGLYYIEIGEDLKKSKISKYKFIALVIFTASLFIWLKASTAIVSYAVFIVLLLLTNRKTGLRRFIQKPSTIAIAMVLATVVVLSIETILNNRFVSNIITNVLNEDLTLTTRTVVYARIMSIVEKSPWIGYGYNNAAMYLMTEWASNAQNGLFDIIIDYGLIGGFFTVATVVRCFRHASESESIGLHLVVYALVTASIVEVSYNYVFFFTAYSIICGKQYEMGNIEKSEAKRKYMKRTVLIK